MKKLEKNKGITLIALIITIIVMLILVGVTVNVALNGGLFNKAKEAAVKTNKAAEEEKELQIALEIEMTRDKLLREFPVGNPIIYDASGAMIALDNTNIIDLFEYILVKYYGYQQGEVFENLKLKDAILASQKLFAVYNPEVKECEKIVYDGQIHNYWSLLGNASFYDNEIYSETGSIYDAVNAMENKMSEEEIETKRMKIEITTIGVAMSENRKFLKPEGGLESRDLIFAHNGDVNYGVVNLELIADLVGIFPGDDNMRAIFEDKTESELNEIYDNAMNFELLSGLDNYIIQVNSSNINDFIVLDTENNEEFMGKILLVMDIEDPTSGKRIATPLKDVLLFDTKLGDTYYVGNDSTINGILP